MTDHPFTEPPALDASTDPNDETFGDVIFPATLKTAPEYDAVLAGEPYDGAVIGRQGASHGPSGIRTALAGTKSHHFDAGPVRSVGDLGDVAAVAGAYTTMEPSEVQAAVREVVAQIYAADALPVFLGGDNSLSYANVAPLVETGSVGVVSLDAHLDCREVQGEPTSGSPYRQLHEAGLDAFAVVGARHFETSTVYADYVREQGGTIVTAEAVGLDTAPVVERVREAMAGVDRVYVSLDLDVLDAAAAPGVSAPTPGGLTTRELFRHLRALAADDRVVGFEVVECAPRLDPTDRTVRAAARAVAHFLSALDTGPTNG
ncbi:formimidoylglutamase [Halorientalis pallida]|uniref:Formimidoylglutamase n=1 Tax=Halorientalis pallida TaxID=2479928 RepID=A0A498KWP6_9EURY|nr:formimidoylglutamase [Halorientalis pallida]RXK50050.1 formimidoylglutamase [Halorientalis pallida]